MRRRTGCAIAAGAVLAVLAGSLVGWSSPARLSVTRADGTPAAGAVVAFHFYGHRFNFVHSTTYERSGGILRADSSGRVEIPGRLYRKAPLDGYLEPWIDLLYDADSHFAHALGLRKLALSGAYELRADGDEVVIADRTEDAAAWERSLEALHALVAYELVYGGERSRRIPATESEVRELAGALQEEYRALLARHREARREPPPMGPDLQNRMASEREEILAKIAADLEREPLWGGYLERRWESRLEQLENAIADRR